MTINSSAREKLASSVIPLSLALATPCLGLRWEEETLIVGLADDCTETTEIEICAQIADQIGGPVRAERINKSHLLEMVSVYYADVQVSGLEAQLNDPDSEGPVSELLNSILDRAVRLRASDVHFEPTDHDMVVRIRVDGKLEILERVSADVAAPLTSRMKVLAKINIVERRRPQDGQFSLTLGPRSIDVRLATVATLYGEKIVLRLLDTRRSAVAITELGMAGEHLEKFSRLIHSPYGLVVAAGPTGAGKTTTLHSALRELNSPERNVVTLEDPVEYVVPGINHIPVNESIGATFSVQLRAILRQDPDIVLVGEMRDAETARIGIQAALAGRLVLTSLHAPDAVGAIYRLFQMDIEPHLVAASLRGVIAQRLLRKNCEYCSYTYAASPAETLMLKHKSGEELILTKGEGCSMCRGTGYRDRVGLFQILEISDDMRELISKRPDPIELYSLAQAEGMRTLAVEAYDLAVSGGSSAIEAAQWVATDD